MSRLTVAFAAVALASAAAPACGDDDDEEHVRRTVRDFVQAADRRDADRFCDELVSEEFLKRTTGAAGDPAVRACRRQLTAVAGLRLRLVRIGKTEVDGDRARVTAVIESRGRRQVRVLHLLEEDGDWKLTGGG
jgi:ketosteroid isomerase-like protein